MLKSTISYLIILVVVFFVSCQTDQVKSEKPEWAIIIHGGAGGMTPERYSGDLGEKYKKSLEIALSLGVKSLKNNNSALDVVEEVITYLENDTLFNSGKGAVFTHSKTVELDASIMDGATLNAGAVAGIKRIKNPIKAARMVMDKSPHVFLAGEGAEVFAEESGLEMVPNSYFFTKKRLQQIEKTLNKEKVEKEKHGTVGVVVLDSKGNMAAGTSTGGISNKRFGRIGDSPIIGAGTYADNSTCGISATGQGEYFIRLAIAHSISDLLKYKKISIQEAADQIIMKELTQLGGSGGVICLDAHGNEAVSFNTKGMFRAFENSKGKRWISMFGKLN